MRTHYFLAVPLSESIKRQIQQTVQEQWSPDTFKRWVHHLDYHLTLVFLGGVSDEKLDTLMEGLYLMASQSQPFTLTLEEAGTFGLSHRPRIYYVGIEPIQQLNDLQQSVQHTVTRVGIHADTKPFHPHITLARKWQLKESYQPKSLHVKGLSVKVDQIILYQTVFDQEPKYQPLNQLKLGCH